MEVSTVKLVFSLCISVSYAIIAAPQEDAHKYVKKQNYLDWVLRESKFHIKNALDSTKIASDKIDKVTQRVHIKFEKRTALKAKVGFLALSRIYDTFSENRSLDINQLTGLGIDIVAVGNFVIGFSFPGLWALGAAHTVYNIPFVKDSIDIKVFGEYLWGPLASYSLAELNDPDKMNRPYLICNYYKNVDDLVSGKRPTYWNWAKKKHLSLRDERSVYNDYVVVHGRWIRVLAYSTPTFRFATIESPFKFQEACLNLMIDEGQLSLPLSDDDKSKVIPTVGYFRMTRGYNIYHYLPLATTRGTETIHEAILPVSDLQDDEIPPTQTIPQQPDSITTSGSTPTPRVREHVKEQDPLSNFLWGLWTTRNLAGSNNWAGLSFFADSYDYYQRLKKSFKDGTALKLEDYAQMAIDSGFAINYTLNWATNLNLPLLNKIAFVHYTFNAVSFLFPKTPVEYIYGKYLDRNTTYDLHEFEDKTKLNTTYIACNYFESAQTLIEQKQGKPLTWSWANANSLEEQYSDIFDEDKTHIDDNRGWVAITGRWIHLGNSKFGFGTLADPIFLQHACMSQLSKNFDLLPENIDKSNVVTTITAGNTKISFNYPIIYFMKCNSDVDGKGIEVRACPFLPASKQLELR